MENQQPQEPEQISTVIDKLNLPADVPRHPRRPSTYDMLKKTNPEHNLVLRYEADFKAWNDYWDSQRPAKEPDSKQPLKPLAEVDFLSVYNAFKEKYFDVTGNIFDPKANNGETKILAFTLIYYFFNNIKFMDSPLLNKTINEPHVMKGLLVFGDYGCGKTSVFKALKKLFFDAERDNNITVKDVDGDDVLLHRYRRKFGYFSAIDVVQMFEGCSDQQQKDRFWNTMKNGWLYFDDLMTERQASNYGKVEIFEDILKFRYDGRKRTMASLNYAVENSEQLSSLETMQAMSAKYGNRVYDRCFEMFNIIELKGKSLRN